MTEPRKPLLGFLWPTSSTDGPVDDAYRQVRMIRIPGRGIVRLLLLLLATLAAVVISASAVMAAVATSWVLVIPTAVVIATFTVLVLRAWTLGTYVNDAGLAVQRLLRTTSARWTDIAAVVDEGGRVVVRCRDGRIIRTTIARHSLDLLANAEAFDIAKLQLQRWGEQR